MSLSGDSPSPVPTGKAIRPLAVAGGATARLALAGVPHDEGEGGDEPGGDQAGRGEADPRRATTFTGGPESRALSQR